MCGYSKALRNTTSTWSQKIGPKKFDPKKIGPKKIGPKIIGPKIIGPKSLVHKNIGPQKYWSQNNCWNSLFFGICCFFEICCFLIQFLEICCFWNLLFLKSGFEIGCFLKSVVFLNLLYFEICCFWNLLLFVAKISQNTFM